MVSNFPREPEPGARIGEAVLDAVAALGLSEPVEQFTAQRPERLTGPR